MTTGGPTMRERVARLAFASGCGVLPFALAAAVSCSRKAESVSASAAPGSVGPPALAEGAARPEEPGPDSVEGPPRRGKKPKKAKKTRKRPCFEYLSPVALVAARAPDGDGKMLFVAEHAGEALAVFEVASGKVTRRVPLPGRPSGVALSADGRKLYVTVGSDEGEVCVLAADGKGKIERTVPVGHTPGSPVASPDGKTLYVCNRFDDDVSVVDLATGREAARVEVTREPTAAAITPDGKTLFVANHLPAGRADGDYAAAVVSVIDTASRKVTGAIRLPNGSTGLRGAAVSPDGGRAYVTHILARYQLPTTQLERGWVNTNALTVIDVGSAKRVNTVLLDDVDLGAANPFAVACTPDGKHVVVTHAGTHELSVIDRAALDEKLAKVARGEKVSSVSTSAEDVPNDLAFLVGLRRRLRFKGNGPRGLAILEHDEGTKVYAAEYYTDTLGVIEIDPDKRPGAESLALGPAKEPSVVRRGEAFFYDAEHCFQQWHSCASCHPDGRADGLNWDLLNDGFGNPKNAKSMLLSHRTPPVMVTGIRPDAETAVRAGIRYIQLVVRPDEDAKSVDEFLKSMEPVPSPRLVEGDLSASARRGAKVFEKAGCASCHPAPLYTDMQKHDVGTGTGREKGLEFDTPTLVEVWRTAPYLYDGRAATMRSVLVEHNEPGRHGRTAGLSEKEIDALVEFVLSQ